MQLQVLECVFQTDPLPRRTLRTELATQLGITPRCVQVWFQNRRQKWKHSHQAAGQPVPALANSTQSRYNNLEKLLAPAAGGTAPPQPLAGPPMCVPLDRQSTPATPDTLVGVSNDPITLPLAPSRVDRQPHLMDCTDAPSAGGGGGRAAGGGGAADPSVAPTILLPAHHAQPSLLPPIAPSADAAGRMDMDAPMPLMIRGATQPPLVMPSPSHLDATVVQPEPHPPQPPLPPPPPPQQQQQQCQQQAFCVAAASQPALVVASEGLMVATDAAGAGAGVALGMPPLTPLRLVGLQHGTGAPIFECLPAEAAGGAQPPPMAHPGGALMRWTPQGALVLPYTLVACPAAVQPAQPAYEQAYEPVQMAQMTPMAQMAPMAPMAPMAQTVQPMQPMQPLMILPAPGGKPSPPAAAAPMAAPMAAHAPMAAPMAAHAPMAADAVAAATAALQEELAAFAAPQAAAP